MKGFWKVSITVNGVFDIPFTVSSKEAECEKLKLMHSWKVRSQLQKKLSSFMNHWEQKNTIKCEVFQLLNSVYVNYQQQH
jgi:hypothetical protein